MEMTHEQYMELALKEAEKAAGQGEVPIGAGAMAGRHGPRGSHSHTGSLRKTAELEAVRLHPLCYGGAMSHVRRRHL